MTMTSLVGTPSYHEDELRRCPLFKEILFEDVNPNTDYSQANIVVPCDRLESAPAALAHVQAHTQICGLGFRVLVDREECVSAHFLFKRRGATGPRTVINIASLESLVGAHVLAAIMRALAGAFGLHFNVYCAREAPFIAALLNLARGLDATVLRMYENNDPRWAPNLYRACADIRGENFVSPPPEAAASLCDMLVSGRHIARLMLFHEDTPQFPRPCALLPLSNVRSLYMNLNVAAAPVLAVALQRSPALADIGFDRIEAGALALLADALLAMPHARALRINTETGVLMDPRDVAALARIVAHNAPLSRLTIEQRYISSRLDWQPILRTVVAALATNRTLARVAISIRMEPATAVAALLALADNTALRKFEALFQPDKAVWRAWLRLLDAVVAVNPRCRVKMGDTCGRDPLLGRFEGHAELQTTTSVAEFLAAPEHDDGATPLALVGDGLPAAAYAELARRVGPRVRCLVVGGTDVRALDLAAFPDLRKLTLFHCLG